MLPRLPNISNIASRTTKSTTSVFGGYDHNPVISDAEMYDMQNLSSDGYPTMSPRKDRTMVDEIENFNGITTNEGLIYAAGTSVFIGDTEITGFTDTPKTFVPIDNYVCIWPDKIAIDITDKSKVQMELAYPENPDDEDGNGTIDEGETRTLFTFGDGEYAGEEAKANSITTSGFWAFPFSVGDAVTIAGCVDVPYNNRTPVIREISEDGKTLRFYENTFRMPSDDVTSYTETGIVTVTRKVPDVDYVICHENRLWACINNDEGNKGTILCTARGLPFVWYDYDTPGDGAWASSVMTDGPFTGAVSYGGYAIFFKEENIHKVYGSKPSNFEIMSSAVSGVKAGCAQSITIAQEVLYYVSNLGVTQYQNGIPFSIGSALGTGTITGAVAGSDMKKVYMSLCRNNVWELLAYDPSYRVWHKEDNTHVLGFARQSGVLYAVVPDGEDSRLITMNGDDSDDVEWFAEFGEHLENSVDKKFLKSFQMDIRADNPVDILLSRNSGEFELLKTIDSCGERRRFVIPVHLHRVTTYRLRLEGVGDFNLYTLTTQYISGSARRGASNAV